MRYDKMLGAAIGFIGKYKYLFIVAAVGLVLLIVPFGATPSETQKAAETEEFDVRAVEERIAEALSHIEGVGRAEVVLSPERTMQSHYHSDSKDGNASTVVVGIGSGVQEAVVVSRIYPEYRGALVVCEGGGVPSIRLEVTRAVAALTGLSSDKIIVQKSN